MTLHHGDCLDVMAGMEPESVDAIVTDPPYDLTSTGARNGSPRSNAGTGPYQRLDRGGFMGKTWDGTGIAFDPETWAAALRVAKPSAYLLAFGGTRTVHRMTCAIEDAGWIIRDMLVWGYACLSDDTEVLTSEGWVRYNKATDGQLAAAFDPATGDIFWSPILAVHRYDHTGQMAEVGPSLVTLNHRVILDAATARVPRLPGVWDGFRAPVGMGQEGQSVLLLESMQRHGAPRRSALPPGDASRLDRGVTAVREREDDRPAQSGLEGRRYRVQEARELLGSPVRAGSGVGAPDGSQGWLRDGAPAPDGRDVRLPVDADGMRQPRGPRSDEQRPGEPDALAGQPDAQALRMGQVSGGDGGPDAVRLVDGYSGVVWCITVPSGAFVARRNGVVFVTGNSGFPKSRASLKPSWEPIVLARKPGPLRMLAIDACRIPSEAIVPFGTPTKSSGGILNETAELREPFEQSPLGRWPANIILTATEDGRAIFDGGIEGVVGGGTSPDPPASYVRSVGMANGVYGAESRGAGDTMVGYGDSGTYSRFFLIPKADRADREPVLGGLPKQWWHQSGAVTEQGQNDGIGLNRPKLRANVHPTVKPVDLMRHLVRLVTPTGGIVLDCFAGSGSTLLAAEMEGFGWVGIEREAEYVAIAEARLNGVQRGLGLPA